MDAQNRSNASYPEHVANLERRFSTDTALRHAVGGEFLAIGQIEFQLLRSRGLKDDHVIVDVGCGSGRLACQLAGLPGLRYLGTDVVPRLLDYARELCARPDWEFVQTDGARIPCADGTADFVTFFSVFTHLSQEEIFRYFREAYRVLKPGGIMVMSFLEFCVPLHWATFIASVDGTRDDQHRNEFIERDSIHTWAGAAGFEVRSIHGGDTQFIPLSEEIRFEDGTRLTGHASLGQSVAVLQKSLVPTLSPKPEVMRAPARATAGVAALLANASCRTHVPAGGAAILGFTLQGEAEREVLIRAVGPGLAVFGVQNPLPQPHLEIFRGETLCASADAWNGAPACTDAIRRAHAFSLAPTSADAVVVVRLPPGSYTAVVKSTVPGSTGEVLTEVYVL